MLEDYYYDVVYQPLVNLPAKSRPSSPIHRRHRPAASPASIEATLTAMSDAVMVVAPDGDLELTNAAFERFFGPSRTFVPEDEPGHPLPEADWPQRRAANGESYTMLFTLREAEGTDAGTRDRVSHC